jgi:hypothetical protein
MRRWISAIGKRLLPPSYTIALGIFLLMAAGEDLEDDEDAEAGG